MKPIFFILLLGLAVRLWGIQFGLPDTVHADEPIVVNHALAYGSGDLNPHFFKIPPLTSYLLFLSYGIYYLIGNFHGIENFKNLFFDDPTSFYLIARIFFGAMLGTATIYLLYRLIRKYFLSVTAVLSALFFSLVFLHVRDSHFIYADMPLVLVLVACFFPLMEIVESGALIHYVLFGVLAGVAVAFKYNGVFIFIPFLFAHFLGRGLKINFGFFAVGLVSVLVYSMLNPFTWVDFRFFIQDLRGQAGSTGAVGLLHHLTYSLVGGITLPLLIAAVIGICLARDKKRWVFGSFVISYYLLLCFFSQPYERYVLPIVPFLMFFATDCLVWLQSKFKISNLVLGIAAVLVILPSAIKVALCDQILSKPDIRLIAKKNFESEIASGSRVALDTPQFMPKLNFSLNQLQDKKVKTSMKIQAQRIDRFLHQNVKNRYDLYFLNDAPDASSFTFSSPQILPRIEDLRSSGIQYVLIAKIKPNRPSFYQNLVKNADLVAVYNPFKDQSRKWPIDSNPLTGAPFQFKDLLARNCNGHIIEVYKLKQ